MTITVFVLDDHEMVRRGLRDILATEDDIDVIANVRRRQNLIHLNDGRANFKQTRAFGSADDGTALSPLLFGTNVPAWVNPTRTGQPWFAAAMTVVSAWLGWLLFSAEKDAAAQLAE